MFILLLIASAFAACSHKNFASCSSYNTKPSYDYMLHVQTWRGQFCSEKCCDLPKGDGSINPGFQMHGWWPQFTSGYPSCCQTETKADAVTKMIKSDSDMKKKIQYYWPSLSKCKFFEYEYTKHGTCVSNYYSGSTGPKKYLNGAIYLLQQSDLWNTFKNAGAVADGRTSISKETLRNAVKSKVGANSALFICSGSKLSEVRLCTDLNLNDLEHPKFIDCPSNIYREESCGSNIIFAKELSLKPVGCDY